MIRLGSAAWGVTTGGKPIFVGLDTSSAESTDAWHSFLTDLGARGLRCPLRECLGLSD